MTYTETMLEAEKLAHLTGETRGEWYMMLTGENIGDDDE